MQTLIEDIDAVYLLVSYLYPVVWCKILFDIVYSTVNLSSDDSLTLDSLYQKTAGEITAITARDMKYLQRKGETGLFKFLWLMCILQDTGIVDPLHTKPSLERMKTVMKLCGVTWSFSVGTKTLRFIYMYVFIKVK